MVQFRFWNSLFFKFTDHGQIKNHEMAAVIGFLNISLTTTNL